MLKRLHVFILKSFFRTFLIAFFVAMFVLMMNFIKRFADDLIGKGLDLSIILEVFLYGAAGMVSMGLPLAILIASIMTLGDLGENFELTAMKSTGISLFKIIKPLIVLISIISVLMFFYSNHTTTYSNLKLRTLVFDINKKSPEISFKTGLFNNDIEGYTLRFGKRNSEGMLYDFMIYDQTSEKGNIAVSTADSAEIQLSQDEKYMLLTLYNGNNYQEHLGDKEVVRTGKHQQNSFQKQSLIYELQRVTLERSSVDIYKHDSRTQNLKELEEATAIHTKELANVRNDYSLKLLALRNSGMNQQEQQSLTAEADFKIKSLISQINRRDVEWHRKFVLSLTCLIFFFIGAPLGAIIRKGGVGISIFISITLFILFHIISIAGEKLVREDVLSAFVGMWFPTFILFPVGIFLTYKAANDSTFLDIDTYFNFFKKIFKKK